MTDLTGLLPQPERRLITTRGEYLAAMDAVIMLARRELAVFDPDLVALELNAPARIERLRAFLAAGRDNKLSIAVHAIDAIKQSCPRLLTLLVQHSANVAIHRTEGDAARVQDCFVLADAYHFVRRPVASQARGAVALNDEKDGHGMRERFGEIWTSSVPAVTATTIGL